MKKRVLIDLRFLRNLYYGFGQLCYNYGKYLEANPIEDLDITVLVPEQYVGKFGPHVKYLKLNPLYKLFPFLMPRFDVWHSVTQSPRYFSIEEGCSRVMTIHDLNFMYDPISDEKKQRKLKRLQDFIDMSDRITVISNFTKEEVARDLDLSKKNVVVNYVGLRDITKDPEEKPDFVDDGRQFFFTIGQVVLKKNFHVLVEMMALMPEYDLYISGQEVGDYGDQIRAMIEDKGLKNVFLTGPISNENKVWLYRNCYAFVFPSKFEGFGIPVIDGMRFEKPVFSSQLTSLKEIGDRYAYFWNNFEPEHMCDVVKNNIDEFYANPELMKAAKEYADSYTIERHFENYLDIYRSLPKKSRSIWKTLKNYIVFLRN